jgi:histone H3/H4
MENSTTEWRKCSSCKKPIGFNKNYYECSVSTCTGLRTGYVFCSVSCWEVHLPGAKHRNAGAVEKRSPNLQQYQATLSQTGNEAPMVSAAEQQPARRIIVASAAGTPGGAGTASSTGVNKSSMANEVLVVVSKMKQHIRDLSEMNTSEDVNQVLSDIIRRECEKAIAKARADGRKTVMARDFK